MTQRRRCTPEEAVAAVHETVTQLSGQQSKQEARYEAAFDGSAARPDPGLSRARSRLVVPFGFQGDGSRPLSRRPDGPSAISRLSRSNPQILNDGGDVNRLEPAVQYKLEATLQNTGGLDLPPTTVEFFVEHRRLDTWLDRDGDDNRADVVVAPKRDAEITGWTTLPPRTTFLASTNAVHNVVTTEVKVEFDRTFSIERDFRGADSGDVGSIVLKAGPERTARTLDKASLRFEADPPETRKPLPLDARVGDVEFVGREKVRLPTGGTATASVDWTAPDSRGQSVMTAFYVRTYSVIPPDIPPNWGDLYHVVDRHVGRSERHWEGVG